MFMLAGADELETYLKLEPRASDAERIRAAIKRPQKQAVTSRSNQKQQGPEKVIFPGPFLLSCSKPSADTEIQQMTQLVFLSPQVMFRLVAGLYLN